MPDIKCSLGAFFNPKFNKGQITFQVTHQVLPAWVVTIGMTIPGNRVIIDGLSFMSFVTSNCYPELSNIGVYLRGSSRNGDSIVATRVTASKAETVSFFNFYRRLLQTSGLQVELEIAKSITTLTNPINH